MNRVLLYLGCVILFGCNPEPKRVFPIPNEKDINEIIATVTADDSLFYNKSRRPLSIDLQKIKIYKSDSGLPPSPPSRSFSLVGINELINEKYHKQKLFSRIDSAYLFFQNDTLQKLKLNATTLSGFTLTTIDSVLKKDNLRKSYPYIAITIPVFSLDQKKAYLEINDYCGMCGGGIGVYLKKINGRWEIIESFSIWMS